MPRWPTAPFDPHRTGCYGCRRITPADGSCGVHDYPCTHWGVDTFTLDGSREVVAPERGTVAVVTDGRSPPWVGYGPGLVLLAGASGFYHMLAHLESGSVRVRVGQQLAEGAPIGRFDAEYGHCHYEVRRKPIGPSSSNTIDPALWLREASRSSSISSSWLWSLVGLGVIGYAVYRYRSR